MQKICTWLPGTLCGVCGVDDACGVCVYDACGACYPVIVVVAQFAAECDLLVDTFGPVITVMLGITTHHMHTYTHTYTKPQHHSNDGTPHGKKTRLF